MDKRIGPKTWWGAHEKVGVSHNWVRIGGQQNNWQGSKSFSQGQQISDWGAKHLVGGSKKIWLGCQKGLVRGSMNLVRGKGFGQGEVKKAKNPKCKHLKNALNFKK